MVGRDLDLRVTLQEELARWPEGAAGAAVVDENGLLAAAGDDGPFSWASVTKVLTSLTVLHAAAEGSLDLDESAGPDGATVRHLLAHTSGLSFDADRVMAPPGHRRIYSNRGIELAARHLELRAGRTFAVELRDRVLKPLGLSSVSVSGSPARGGSGTVTDLTRLATELLRPRWFSASLLAEATTTAFPGTSGLLPGFGRQELNDWGLGFEIRGRKSPHWTSVHNTPATFGHFGQSGCFLWVDPGAGLACVGAGSNPFGTWAAKAWPRLSTRVLAAVRPGRIAHHGAVEGADEPSALQHAPT